MYNLEALKKPIFKIISDCSESLNVPSYVVGGYVRDIILSGKKSNDIDIVAIGDGIELAKAVSNALPNKPKVSVYKTYGTAMICHNNIDLEFVGARRESYQKNSRNPKVFTGSIEDDQKRRDFTINALAISLNKVDYGKILDPFDGIKDLNRKRIITPLDPNITFSDDPLRMLRAIRFASQLNFKVDDNCIDAIKKNSNRIKIITKERIVV